ncbi:MAG: SRPBCC domain-containing protein [Pseudomonadota bacterium]
MSILKWAVLAVVMIAVAGDVFTRKTFHVETVIAAPPEKAWAVLMDTSAYPEWNPVFVSVDGKYTKGAQLLNKVKDPSGKILEMTATVTEVTTNKMLRQRGGIWGVITFDHQWILEPVPGGTKVIQHEVDRGLFLWFWDSSWIEPSYARTNEALKKRVMDRSAQQ